MTSSDSGIGSPPGPVDWEDVRGQYRAGLLSLREIAIAHHVSHTAIRKRAARDGWRRDLQARIRAKADALVSRSLVAKQVSTEVDPVTLETDARTVAANAEVIAQVRLRHRRDIARARLLTTELLGEIERLCAASSSTVPTCAVTDAVAGGVESVGPTAAVREPVDLASRALMLRSLVGAMGKLIRLERQAYDLDLEPEQQASTHSQIAEILREIDGAGTGLPSRHAREPCGRRLTSTVRT